MPAPIGTCRLHDRTQDATCWSDEDSIHYAARHYAHVRCLLAKKAHAWELILTKCWEERFASILANDPKLIDDFPPPTQELVQIIARKLKNYPLLLERLRKRYPVETAMGLGEPMLPFVER